MVFKQQRNLGQQCTDAVLVEPQQKNRLGGKGFSRPPWKCFETSNAIYAILKIFLDQSNTGK